MGYWNFFLFNKKSKNEIMLISRHIQTIMPDFEINKLKMMFNLKDIQRIKNPPTVLHYCGNNKAYAFTPFCYSEPMTFFRKKYLTDSGTKTTLSILLTLLTEDFGYFYRIYRSKFIKKIKALKN